MNRDEARQKQINAGEAGKTAVGLKLGDAERQLKEAGFTTLVDYRDGKSINLMAAMNLTIGRVRLQVQGTEVIGYAVG